MTLDNIVYSPSTLRALSEARTIPQEVMNYACDSNCDDGGCDSEGDIDSGCDQD